MRVLSEDEQNVIQNRLSTGLPARVEICYTKEEMFPQLQINGWLVLNAIYLDLQDCRKIQKLAKDQ